LAQQPLDSIKTVVSFPVEIMPAMHSTTFYRGEVGLRGNPVNPMNHSNMNPNDGDGFGSTSQTTHIDYALAPTINYAPAMLHVPPAHEEEFNTPMSRQNDPTPNNYVTIAGGDDCNSGRVDNRGWSDNIEARDIGQNVCITRNLGEAANAFLAQAFHVGRWPDSPFNPLGECDSDYYASDNAVPQNAEHQERSQAQWADSREQDRNQAHVRTL
jgi:hypothetical protein